MKKSGFSLLEVLIVLLLVLFFATLTVNFTSIYDTVFVQAEIQKLRSLMLYLKAKAPLEQKVQAIVFNVQENSYSINNSGSNKLSPKIQFNIIGAIKGPPGRPIQAITKPVTFKNNSIFFYPDGTISAGTIYLTDSKKKVQYAISCDASEANYIRCYKYAHDSWTIITLNL